MVKDWIPEKWRNSMLILLRIGFFMFYPQILILVLMSFYISYELLLAPESLYFLLFLLFIFIGLACTLTLIAPIQLYIRIKRWASKKD